MSLDQPPFPLRAQVRDCFVEREICWDLSEILSVKSRRNRSAQSQFTRNDGPLAHQRTKERRLAATVGTNEPDDIATLNRGGEIRDERSAFHFNGDVASNCNLVAAAFLDVERKAE